MTSSDAARALQAARKTKRYVRLASVLAQLDVEVRAKRMAYDTARKWGPNDRILRCSVAKLTAEACLESVRSEFEEPDEPGFTDEADVRETIRLNRAADARQLNRERGL